MKSKTVIIAISALVLIIVLLTAGVFGKLLLFALLAVAYFGPTIVAYVRKAPNIGSVAVVNFFFGITGIGWIIALVMAMKDPTPAVHVVVNNTTGDAS